jgi:hypothetical protein
LHFGSSPSVVRGGASPRPRKRCQRHRTPRRQAAAVLRLPCCQLACTM